MDSICHRTTFRCLRKRSILFTVALLSLVLFLAGCGVKKTDGRGESPTAGPVAGNARDVAR